MKNFYIPESLREELTELIRMNEISKVLELLNTHFKGKNKKVNHFFSRWKEYKKRAHSDVLSLREERNEYNLIVYDLIDFISNFPNDEFQTGKHSHESVYNKIFNHEENDLWETLEKVVIDAVLVGGTTAMGYYREAWKKSEVISKGEKNPSTVADIQATISILRVLDSYLPKFAKKLNCKLLYFGEETTDDLLKHSKGEITKQIYESIVFEQNEFFKPSWNTIRVIFDAIDGTSNFSKGFPFFCSAVAIIIDNTARISAIYDPVHHIVYSAVLMGPEVEPARDGYSKAHIWNISSGNRTNLIDQSINTNHETKKIENESIGIHLSRNPLKRYQMRNLIGIDTSYYFSNHTYSEMLYDGLDNEIVEILKNHFDDKLRYNNKNLFTIIEKAFPSGISKEALKVILKRSEKTKPNVRNNLENLCINTGGIFALNSGILAMAETARGSLGGFVNPATNAWDVTAGEVLIKAVKGKVVDFNGRKIDYTKPGPVSVVSAKNDEIFKSLKELLEIPSVTNE